MGSENITRAGVVLPVRVDPKGITGPTPKAVRGRRWRRVGRGWYVPAEVAPGHLDQRIVEAVAGLPAPAAVTGWAALGWLGGRWFTGRTSDGESHLPVPVALGDQHVTSQRVGVLRSEDWLFAGDVVVVDGLRITIPNRSVTFETRRAGTLLRAVQVIDMAADDDLIELEDLAAYVGRLVARPGIKLARRAVPLAEENVWSPQETTMRLVWLAAVRSAVLLCNAPVFDRDGNHLFTPDLFDPEAGIAGEYNGRVHLDEAPFRRDLDKEAAYRHHGIEVVTMMSGDRYDTDNFERRLRAAYQRAARRTLPTSWTLDQPDWWVDTSTVALRRALSHSERATWLRRRRRT